MGLLEVFNGPFMPKTGNLRDFGVYVQNGISGFSGIFIGGFSGQFLKMEQLAENRL